MWVVAALFVAYFAIHPLTAWLDLTRQKLFADPPESFGRVSAFRGAGRR